MSDDRSNDGEGYSVFEDASEESVDEHTDESEETHASLEHGHDRGCPKCGHEETVTDVISTTGGGLSKFFDIQNRRFTVVSCEQCGYSELYRGRSEGDIVDIFLG